jgi:hypothetical protein
MSEALPAYPAAQCPTCHREHSAALMPGETTTILCDCGKLLKLEKASVGNTIVVIEQITPLPAVAPAE